MENADIKNQKGFLGINQENQEKSLHENKHLKVNPEMSKINEKFAAISRTLRILEERYMTLRKKTQISDKNIIYDTNKIFTELKLAVNDISEIKVNIEEMQQKLETFSSEIKDMANSKDLKILQKYIELWEPIQFLTEKEAIKIINDYLKKSD